VDIILIVVLLVSFFILAMGLKWPVSLSLAATSIIVAIAAGQFNADLPEHLANGSFGYLDVSLVLITAMIFMKVIEKNGLLKALTRNLIIHFGHSPLALLIVITILIMFPGAITGSCSASVLSTGVLLAPVLMQLNMPRHVAGAIITMASVYGMIAPPVNIIVMIIGAGIDVPYIGFNGLLMMVILPLAILSTLFMGYKYARQADLHGIVEKFRAEETEHGFMLYLPLIVMLVLMIVPKIFPQQIPDPSLPLTFTIAIILACFSGKKFNVLQAAKEGTDEILSIVSLLIGVGMLIEVMTLVGLRGFIVVSMLSVPAYLMMLGMAISLPAFGGISVFGSASVLGVPFALALLGSNQIVVITALSIIAAMGSFTPPVALTPVVTAQVIGEPKYTKLIWPCMGPIIVGIIVGLLMIHFAEPIAKLVL
jgi:GntP family gluconate:H+ symporter